MVRPAIMGGWYMKLIEPSGGMRETEPTSTKRLREFVHMSTKDKTMVEEFARITAEYEEMAQKLEDSGIPQRRAEIILALRNSGASQRSYREIGQMLGGMTPSRISQILAADRRRQARKAAQNDA